MFAGCVHGCPGEGETHADNATYGLGVRHEAWSLFDVVAGEHRARAKRLNVRFLSGPVWPEELRPSPTRLQLNVLYKSSVFCLAPTAAGWGHRFYTSIMHGCIPVVPHDDVALPFEELIPWTRMAVISGGTSDDLNYLPERLSGLSRGDTVLEMHRELACVWPRLTWSGSFRAMNGESASDDAFSTLLLVLRSRMLNATDEGTDMQLGPFGSGAIVSQAREAGNRGLGKLADTVSGIWRSSNGGCDLRLITDPDPPPPPTVAAIQAEEDPATRKRGCPAGYAGDDCSEELWEKARHEQAEEKKKVVTKKKHDESKREKVLEAKARQDAAKYEAAYKHKQEKKKASREKWEAARAEHFKQTGGTGQF